MIFNGIYFRNGIFVYGGFGEYYNIFDGGNELGGKMKILGVVSNGFLVLFEFGWEELSEGKDDLLNRGGYFEKVN